MAVESAQEKKRLENRSLLVAIVGNLLMAAAGLFTGLVANSNAIMVDGLFSLIGFGSAFLARRINRRINAGPDNTRPFGYAADEAIFTTFRSLSLLGLVLFAVANAFGNIYEYIRGAPPVALNFTPMIAYFAGVGLTCAFLWGFHHFTWRLTGRTSAILRLEARAAMFDGAITAAAGLGLGAIYMFRDGPLAAIAPIGDSLIVLLLCLLAVGSYVSSFKDGLSELAHVTASPNDVAVVRRALRQAITDDGGVLTDVSVTKMGRTFFVTTYYNPRRPVLPTEVDGLNLRMIHDVREVLPGADVLLVITEHPRRWPNALHEY
ncbi:MAG: cation transporter [Pseudomonadota bacterium]